MLAPTVKPGDRVAVIAPSGIVDPKHLARGVAWLRERYEVVTHPQCDAKHGFLAGDDTARTDALLGALRDRRVRAIFAARGGYGATRVLEQAGNAVSAALRRDPKPIVGFSDITALHALWARVGVRSVHAPMVGAIGRGAASAEELGALVAAVEGAAMRPWKGLATWRTGVAHGTSRGGNLALLAALAGTPWMPSLDGAVLFLEDIGEHPYRVDRMLTTLRSSGVLGGVTAVVLGDFTACDAQADGVTVEEVLRERLTSLGVPVLAGGVFGHGRRNRPFPLGVVVSIRRGGSVVFEVPGA